ncbi:MULTISPECIES: cell division protein ZapA [unclassified Psychrobacter]|uniref:cell division protein ZapA n=1 Tax=unclassified Psychrobacter TaxID=196806 RepID=UPI00078E4980|nr:MULTISPECIES: cell division protein ZapA [unclassified Psychrobacter]AMN50378.1 cell division protein ZapA [Psychrobacter sp. P2G3]AMN68276.1 cell division protein ZapA [Psychrobacter sp. P11G5]
MTDNNSNATQNDKLQSEQNQKQHEHADNAKSTSAQAVTSNNTASNASTKSAAPEPQMKKVDIVIAGVTYQIYCPVNEEAELRSAVYYINDFLLNIKREAPNLGQENLLVLCCLNLYEKIHAHKKTDNETAQASKQAEALLSKIMKDAQSIL